MNKVRALKQDIEKASNLKQRVADRGVGKVDLSNIPRAQTAGSRRSDAQPSAREMQLERDNVDLMEENKKLVKQKSILG